MRVITANPHNWKYYHSHTAYTPSVHAGRHVYHHAAGYLCRFSHLGVSVIQLALFPSDKGSKNAGFSRFSRRERAGSLVISARTLLRNRARNTGNKEGRVPADRRTPGRRPDLGWWGGCGKTFAASFQWVIWGRCETRRSKCSSG